MPIIHGKFRDIGEDRGQSAIVHALRPIDELNLACTRLHDMLFRYGKADRALVGALQQVSGGGTAPPPKFSQAKDVEIGQESFYRLPAGWDLKDLVAPVPYGQALQIDVLPTGAPLLPDW